MKVFKEAFYRPAPKPSHTTLQGFVHICGHTEHYSQYCFIFQGISIEDPVGKSKQNQDKFHSKVKGGVELAETNDKWHLIPIFTTSLQLFFFQVGLLWQTAVPGCKGT